MNDTTETERQTPVEVPQGTGWDTSAPRSNRARRKGPGVLVLTPPPASVPAEFLDVQNPPVSPGIADAATPPPASVPSEFLFQQEPEVVVAVTPASQMKDYLQDGHAPYRHLEAGIWPFSLDEEERPEAERVAIPEEVSETVRIRGVPLVQGEVISTVLLSEEGVTDSLPRTGPALILTNRRVIAFRGVEGFRDTHIAAASGITQCSVRTGQRNWGAVLQGFLMMVSGAFLYVVVAYWLAGQISGPNVPVINIDVAPLIALLIILAGLLVLLQNYFTRPAGALVFRGPGLELAFPFRSALDIQQIYDFADQVRIAGAQDSVYADSSQEQENLCSS